ncbi:MAG: imidazole glycerol phosphate synthase subunit HisH [Bulleidia sp.]
MIGIIDYGMGNLKSVENALHRIGVPCLFSSDVSVLEQCDRLILPGVGAFPDCMENIRNRNLFEPVINMVNSGKPLLGICLGMQMLYEKSLEMGETEGFGFLKGTVKEMKTDLPIPEIGWNELVFTGSHPLRQYLSDTPYVYYVHSFHACDIEDDQLYAYSMYGDIRVPGLVGKDNVLGAQFHPEKSSTDGLAILKYFAEVMK